MYIGERQKVKGEMRNAKRELRNVKRERRKDEIGEAVKGERRQCPIIK
jgi:hypothetical protein